MKALVFTNHYPASDAPTRGTYNQNTFGALARHCELRVVGPIAWWTRRSTPSLLFNTQRESTFGLDAAFPSYWSIPRATFLHAEAVYWSLRGYVRRLRREFPFDLIIGTWAYPDITAAARMADDANCPLVATVLGTDVNDLPRDPLLRPQIKRGLLRAQRVVTVSHAMVDRVVELGIPRHKVVVQHNGVEGDRFAIRDRAEARRRVKIDHDRPVILYVGNVKIAKGVGVLIDAMKPLIAELGVPGVEICIVGSGSVEPELQARARELGVGANVRFCGRQLHSEIPYWMAACDVFCLPSFNEGCPNVILEALACGRPVVASRVGGIPELLDKGNGVMTPVGEPAALARGLAEALGRTWDPAALRATVEFLSWEAVGDRYRDLLNEVMDDWNRGIR